MPRVPRAAASLLTALALIATAPVAEAAAPAVGLDGARTAAERSPKPARASLRTHLLDESRLPTVGGHAWESGQAHTGAVGACQKTELETIGAVETLSRTHATDAGVTVVQVVARFVDTRSAWRAHRVLAAWREDCESRVADSAVGPLEAVTVSAGRGESYLATFATGAAGLGILRSGTHLTLVEVTTGPEDYPSRRDPTRVAVRRIARTF